MVATSSFPNRTGLNASSPHRRTDWCVGLAYCVVSIFIGFVLAQGALGNAPTVSLTNTQGSPQDAELAAAVEANDLARVDKALASGANPNVLIKSMAPALVYAIGTNKLEVVRRLMNANADPNATAFGVPAVIFAIDKNNSELVSLLIRNGADCQKRIDAPANNPMSSRNGRNALMVAVERASDDLTILNLVLETNRKLLLSSRDNDGKSPLMLAANRGSATVIEALIKAGATVDAVNLHDYGATALTYAALKGSPFAVEALLKAGANPNHDGTGETGTPLNIAVARNYDQVIRALVKAKVDVNASNRVGFTPLMYAEKPETIKLLLELGANINGKGEGGMPALPMAVVTKSVEVVKALIAAGADVNAKNDLGNTALIAAVRINKPEMLSLLIAAKADVNAANKAGETALAIAIAEKKDSMVALLKQAGAH